MSVLYLKDAFLSLCSCTRTCGHCVSRTKQYVLSRYW